MGLCGSKPVSRSTLFRDSGGHLCEMTVVEPTEAQKNDMRRQAKEMKAQMEAAGFKNVKVTHTFG